MFGKKIHLFSLFGFKVGLDITWLFLAILVTWSLATGLFPYYFEDLSGSTYWWMGVAGAIGLFVSIVFHEFCHSIVARHYGVPMKGITLFIFGGVAEMDKEPDSPKVEFLMALVGPLSSMLLGTFMYLGVVIGNSVNWPRPAIGVLGYLAFLNFILAGFNLLPAFPLDGGRVLRSILWKIKGNLRWATRIASALGSGIGLCLIILGIITFITGGFISGMWYFLIGMFIRGASEMSYRQVVIRKALAGEEVRRFMNAQPVTVPSTVSVEQLINDYFYKYHYKIFPVIDDGQLKGCVTTKQVKALAREQWAEHTVGDLAEACSETNTVSPDSDAMQALSRMNSSENSRLLVVEEGHLLGLVTLKDLLGFLALKIDLEGD